MWWRAAAWRSRRPPRARPPPRCGRVGVPRRSAPRWCRRWRPPTGSVSRATPRRRRRPPRSSGRCARRWPAGEDVSIVEQPGIAEVAREANERGRIFQAVADEVGRAVVGQRYLVRRLLTALLADGHILLEGVPGLAKTLSVSTLAQTVGGLFQRIQFTPDLLPADIIGTEIYDPRTGEFRIKQGPIFANLILADEINRAPAKVQSALLEAMQERQLTIGPSTFRLPEPFLVLATQNPIEQEGTYPLPEAQVDRFMLKVLVGYPSREEELEIINRTTTGRPPTVRTVVQVRDILHARETVHKIYVDEKLKKYIVDIVFATREPKAYGLDLARWIEYGASPRASIYLTLASKAQAFLEGRGHVLPDDVKAVAMDVLRHRVMISYEAEAEEVTSESLVTQILSRLQVP
ncbi:MAG: MoxR family ATPase [Armatimonadetes bacterium]|nr:MoxR family ATPase [Armatimonadota bacterium]